MADQEGEKTAFDKLKYKHYFRFDSFKDERNIIVRCKLCSSSKTLSTSKHSISNLSKHLSKIHSNVKLVGENPADNSSGCDARLPKQQKLDFGVAVGSVAVCGDSLKRLVAGYIIEEMLPISTVDSPSFRRIIEKIPTKNNT